MRKFMFQKLIRDKILTSMLDHKCDPKYHKLSPKDYLSELKNKLIEESSEINLDNIDDLVEELADLVEVIEAMLKEVGSTKFDLAKWRKIKKEKFGLFNDKIYVESVEVPDDYPWIKHYLKDPGRYPEIK